MFNKLNFERKDKIKFFMKKIRKDVFFRFLIWLIFLIGGAIISIHFDKIYFYELFNSVKFHVVTMIPGYFLLKLVLRISRNTGKYLNKQGREGALPRLQTNILVTTGIYGCMRHPMHFGLLFFPLAFALLVGSPVFIMIVAPLEMFLILLMIKLIEEPQAVKKFGNDYIEYKKKVPFFSFKMNCLKQLLQNNS